MTVEDLVALLSLALGVPAIVLQIVREVGRKTPRERLLQDIQIRDALRAGSEARTAMDAQVRESVLKLTGADDKRRDPAGIVVGVALVLAGIGIGVAAIRNGGPWWVLLAPAGVGLVLGITGLVQDGIRRVRDEQGRPV